MSKQATVQVPEFHFYTVTGMEVPVHRMTATPTGSRRLAAALNASGDKAVFHPVKLPKGCGLSEVLLVVEKAAPAKEKHRPAVPDAELGNAEEPKT